MANRKPLRTVVRDTQTIIFDGEVDRISSFNEIGRFDIFPMHANFISIIRQQIVLYNKNQKVKELPVEQAIIKVKQDVVHVFLGIEALLVDELSANNKETPPETPKKK